MACFIRAKFFYTLTFGCVIVLLLCLSACGERDGLAPVSELHWRAANMNAHRHVVVKGETLYAIAFRYDQDYRQIAMTNHLHSPYTLRVGQQLRLQVAPVYPTPRSRVVPQRTVQSPVVTRAIPRSSPWSWPARGRIVETFIPRQGKKGIDIAGRRGEKICAANNGVVAYAGSGLAGYGNLIIIKHDNQYLTAYGNNSRNLVVEGQQIRSGQIIAEMGIVDRRYWGVHFEIRHAGQPVNPLNYLR